VSYQRENCKRLLRKCCWGEMNLGETTGRDAPRGPEASVMYLTDRGYESPLFRQRGPQMRSVCPCLKWSTKVEAGAQDNVEWERSA
jgi:hypothetical protein